MTGPAPRPRTAARAGSLLAAAGGDYLRVRRHAQVVPTGGGEEARLEKRRQSERQHQVERPARARAETALQRRQEERIDAEPEQEGSDGRARHAGGAGPVEDHDGGERQVAADGEELAVGNVDDVED